jgi:hypothetical protein
MRIEYPPVIDYYKTGEVDLKLATLSGSISWQILSTNTTTSGDIVAQIPSLAGYATQSWVTSGFITPSILATTSGDIVSQIPSLASYATLTKLTTTSGDIVAQIPSVAGYATQSWVNAGFPSNTKLTTTSGDIISQIPSLAGYATQGWVTAGFITSAMLATTSGDIVSQIPSLASYVTLTKLTTTSGDIVTQIPSLSGYATQSWVTSGFITSAKLTTTSGDIISQIPSLAGYATESWANQTFIDSAEMTTISGDLVSQMGEGGISLEQLTTTSGDIITQIPSLAGYATEAWANSTFIDTGELTTASGDIVAQIGEQVDQTTLSGVRGIHAILQESVWYIDPDGIQIPVATVSGVSISGTGGMVCTFYEVPGEGGEGYWVIDGSGFTAGIELSYTTVMGTAGSGNGIFWGEAEFTGLSGTNIYHDLGTISHSTLVTPADSIDFNQVGTSMLGEIYVKKGVEYDSVFTTGTGSLGQKFSWMVVQGWPYPLENKSNLWHPVSITSTTSGGVFGQGQETGLQITVSGAGSYILMYTAGVQLNTVSDPVYGYTWLEDGYNVVPKSHARLGNSDGSLNGVYQHVTNSVHLDQAGSKTYKLCASRDNLQTPTSMYVSGGTTYSGAAETSSSLMVVPVALMAQNPSSTGGVGLTNLVGAGGIQTEYHEDVGVWSIDGSEIIGPGGIMYTVGSGAGISYGFATFSGMAGSIIYHNLGGRIHSTIVTPGYLDAPPTEGEIGAIGNIYVVNEDNQDVVYNTGSAGLKFSWVASRGLPYYSSVADHLDEVFTITGSTVAQPTLGQGEDLGLSFSLPPGAWNLCYNLSYLLGSEAPGQNKAWVWVETETEVLNKSIKELSAWSPLQSNTIQHVSHMLQITPDVSQTYTLKVVKDSSSTPDTLYIYGNTLVSGSNSSFLALPAYANGFFGSQSTTGSGVPQAQLVGTTHLETDYDPDTNTWTIDGTAVSGTKGIIASLEGRTWVIDGSGLIVTNSGVWMQGSDNHLSSTVPITSSVAEPVYQTGQDTGLQINVTPGNWAIVYSVSYQMDSEAVGPMGGFTWLEDGYSLVANSELKLHSFAPMMSPTVLNATSVLNYTTQYPVTLKLCGAKNSALPPDNFYLLGGPSASGSNCNIALIPSATLSGSTDSLLFTIEGVGGLSASYADGVWTVDASYLEELRSAWDSVYGGVYSTAKTGSIENTITVTSGVTSGITSGVGYNTGLSVTVGSGTWNIWWQTSYQLLADAAGQSSGYVWLENDLIQVVSGSVSYISTFSPIESSQKKNMSNMVTVSTDVPSNYTLYAAKDLNYPSEYFYIYGGSASEPGSKITAWSPEVYATNVDLGVNNITNNNTFTTEVNNIDSRTYNVIDNIDNFEATAGGVQVSGTLTVTGTLGTKTTIDEQGVTWPNEPKILGLSNLVKTINGGRLELVSTTQINWNPAQHNVIGLYNGSAWELVSPTGTISLATPATQTTISGAAITYDVNYDVYANYLASDNFSLVLQEWATSSGGGTRYVTPQRFQGVLVYDSTTNGLKRRYLGTIRLANIAGAVYADQKDKRFIMNYYNKVRKTFGKANMYAADTHIASSTTVWRRWNNNADWLIEYLDDGLNAHTLHGGIYMESTGNSATAFALDSTTTLAPDCEVFRANTAGNTRHCTWTFTAAEGYHYVYPISVGNTANEYYYFPTIATGAGGPVYATVDGWILC